MKDGIAMASPQLGKSNPAGDDTLRATRSSEKTHR